MNCEWCGKKIPEQSEYAQLCTAIMNKATLCPNCLSLWREEHPKLQYPGEGALKQEHAHLAASVERMDSLPIHEVDSEEYQRIFTRMVRLQEARDGIQRCSKCTFVTGHASWCPTLLENLS